MAVTEKEAFFPAGTVVDAGSPVITGFVTAVRTTVFEKARSAPWVARQRSSHPFRAAVAFRVRVAES